MLTWSHKPGCLQGEKKNSLKISWGRAYFTVRRKKKKKKTRKKRKKTGRMSFQLEPSESLISYLIRNTVEALVSGPLWDEIKGSVIDLFTDTAAILNLFDLRGIMGCLGGHSLSIYARFWGKKRTSLYISREKDDHYYIQTRRNDLFFPLQSFSTKTSRKIGPKSARKYWASISDRAHAPWEWIP